MPRVFLLSPAHSGGQRAQMLCAGRAQFDLAQRLHRGEATLGEVFAFLSGLYFRGKLAYSSAFARPPNGAAGALVITPNRGLLPASLPLSIEELRSFARVPVDVNEPRYMRPLRATCEALRDNLGENCEVVLLGSIATAKYVDCLLETFGDRALFPADFVGRGDMSRGGLMLRCVAAGKELAYLPISGAIRHGQRPPRLERLPRSTKTPPPPNQNDAI